MNSPETSQQNYILPYVKARIQKAKDKKLKKLDLNRTGLAKVPSDVWELEQLEVLNLNDNNLTILPESITKL
ncbi:MAG: hypothetical protein MGG11_17190, partial [Trichodesmium sp. MAG_R03]|nr:hypothetical protein [Trichodesmium sp. MAG_R03]